MPNLAIWFGRLLVLVGIIGYGYGMLSGSASLTALIPAAFGIILMGLGHIAAGFEGMRKHLMHAAVLVALLGFLAGLGGLFRKGMPTTIGAGGISQIVMAVVCLLFVILSVKSFVEARRSQD